MNTAEATQRTLTEYRDALINESGDFDTDYHLGFCNGLEAALALIEGRPAFYVDRQKEYSAFDKKHYPEYFI